MKPDYSNQQLRDADFSGQDLSGVNFSGAKLVNAIFYGTNLSGACFKDAILTCAHFDGAYLINADLRNAHMHRVTLRNTSCYRADFSGADLSYGFIKNSNFGEADFYRAILCNTDFQSSDFKAARHLVQFGPVGSRVDIMYVVAGVGDVMVKCGCFWGTFAAWQRECAHVHDGNTHGQVYAGVAELLRVYAKAYWYITL